MRLLLIVNPHASTVASRTPEVFSRECGHCLNALEETVSYEIFVPDSPEDLRDGISRRLAQGGIDRVVVCGGDGTVTDALPAMLSNPEIPLALVPVGTGNLLAVNLGIPFPIEDALAVAVRGEPQWMDLARMDGHLFILNASVGIDAEIMDKTDREMKKRWGLLAYFIRGVPLLTSTDHAHFSIQVDDKRIRTRAIGVTVFNAGSAVPSGIHLAPDVRFDDGLLHGVIFKPHTWLDYFYGILQLLMPWKSNRRRIIRYFEGRTIRIETQPPLKTQTDGNVVGETPVTMEIIPKKIRICLPPLEMGHRSSFRHLREQVRSHTSPSGVYGA